MELRLKWRFILNWKIKILMLFLFLISGCQTTQNIPTYNGNFPTAQIRGVWMKCSISWRQNNPFIEQHIVWATCDCYTDVIREILTPDQIKGIETIAKEKKLSTVLSKRCNPKTQPVNPT